MSGKCFNAGQTCVAPDYALVPRASVDAFIAESQRAVARMYPTLASNPDYTTIVSDGHLPPGLACTSTRRWRGARGSSSSIRRRRRSTRRRARWPPYAIIDLPVILAVMQRRSAHPPIKLYDS